MSLQKSFRVGSLFFLTMYVVVISSCNKTGSLRVNVRQTSMDGIEVPAAGVTVMVQNLPECHDIKGQQTSDAGVAIFDDLKPGSYRIVAESFDSSTTKWAQGGVQIKKGKSEELTLLIQ